MISGGLDRQEQGEVRGPLFLYWFIHKTHCGLNTVRNQGIEYLSET